MKNIKRATVVAIATGALGVLAGGGSAGAVEITTPGVYSTTYSDEVYQYQYGTLRYLSYRDWVNLGSPQPTPVGSDVVKYPWSPTLYAVTFFQSSWLWDDLSPEEWQRMSRQAPRDAGWIEGSYVYRYATSPQELFIASPDGVQHKLTYAEWAATGFEPPFDYTDEGFYQIIGEPGIYRILAWDGSWDQLTYAEWVALGSPTPELTTGD